MKQEYLHICTEKLHFVVHSQFEITKLCDNSVVLSRYKKENDDNVIFEKQYVDMAGRHKYTLTIPPLGEKDLDALIIIARTSTNHYSITGYTKKKGTTFGYGKTVDDVSAYIKANFCETLFDNVKGVI